MNFGKVLLAAQQIVDFCANLHYTVSAQQKTPRGFAQPEAATRTVGAPWCHHCSKSPPADFDISWILESRVQGDFHARFGERDG